MAFLSGLKELKGRMMGMEEVSVDVETVCECVCVLEGVMRQGSDG